mgnify:CR=1 FL=1
MHDCGTFCAADCDNPVSSPMLGAILLSAALLAGISLSPSILHGPREFSNTAADVVPHAVFAGGRLLDFELSLAWAVLLRDFGVCALRAMLFSMCALQSIFLRGRNVLRVGGEGESQTSSLLLNSSESSPISEDFCPCLDAFDSSESDWSATCPREHEFNFFPSIVPTVTVLYAL